MSNIYCTEGSFTCHPVDFVFSSSSSGGLIGHFTIYFVRLGFKLFDQDRLLMRVDFESLSRVKRIF